MTGTIANIIIILILVITLSAACLYIYKEKKNGKHCIGCPMAGNCPKNKADCSGM